MTELRRLEELGLNSSTPPGQLLYDGWLLRLQPGKAKRARSVNAVYPSTLPIEAKIDHCERVYRARSLPAIFRITPFSQPPMLDAILEARGYGRFDETSVQAAAIDPRSLADAHADALALPEWVDAVGELRGSPVPHRASHLARLQSAPLEMRALALRDAQGIAATGLAIVEDGHAGLFDIITREDARGRGFARRLVASLLRAGAELGARHAYLQVQQDNEPAKRLYDSFGFSKRYTYWYRGRPHEW
ncbi:MAG TPA: GNAT family N-acetyltransferase [Usitatibacter sp.]|jgi:ribosomal protein S18 acetylase RimI-like enzyme|nr:GNAT family N-acetyltransferase [Usitatibacter sp.]